MRRLRRLDRPTLRAAWWALWALVRVRRSLRRHGIEGYSVPEPPVLPDHAGRGVLAVLRRWDHTCLERSLVLQRWEAAHGSEREVIIGVMGPSSDFKAHAWLEGEPQEGVFEELMRLPAH